MWTICFHCIYSCLFNRSESFNRSRDFARLVDGVVINGLIYDADQTAKHLQPALPIVMEKLCNMLELRSKSSKKRKHFLRVHDKKIVALGLMALMQIQEANNQNLLNEQSLIHLMKLLVSLLEDLRHKIDSENSQYQDSLKAYLENAAKLQETTLRTYLRTTKTLRKTRMKTS